MDYRLAQALNDVHLIEGDHEQRVIELAELMILHDAVDKAGWARHTGDWDWGVTVTMIGGQAHTEGQSITFADKPEQFTACVDHAKVTHISLNGYHSDDIPADQQGSDFTLSLPINHIESIRYERL